MEYYATERKKELLPFTTAWTELESIMLGEVSQVVKDNQRRGGREITRERRERVVKEHV